MTRRPAPDGVGGSIERHGWTLAASALVLCAYLLALRSVPKGVFWHPDEGIKFIGLAAIDIDGAGIHYALPYPGVATDPELRFYPGRSEKGDLFPKRLPDGTIGFRWPVLFLLLTKPLVALFGIAGIYVLPLLGGWLTALLAGFVADRHAPPLGPAVVLVVGLATPVAFYSLAFLEHSLATACLMLAIAVTLAPSGGSARRGIIAASLLLAVALRPDTLPLAAAVLLAPVVARAGGGAGGGLPSRRTIVAAVLGTAAAVAVIVLIVPERHRELLATLPHKITDSIWKLPYLVPAFAHVFLGSPAREAWSINRPAEWAAVVATAALLGAPWLSRRYQRLEPFVALAALVVLFEFALHVVLATPPFLGRPGALSIAPFMAVAGYAVRAAWRESDAGRRRLAVMGVLGALLGFGGLFLVRVNLDGSYQVGLDGGSRYLLGLYPLGTLLAVLTMKTYRDSDRPAWIRSAFTVLVIGMMLAGAIYEARGIRRLSDSRGLIARWERALPPTGPVVTDVWWLPATLAPYYLAHPMYFVAPTSGLDEWVGSATARGLQEFTFVTNRTPGPDRLRVEAARATVLSTRFVEGMYVVRIGLAR